MNIENELKLIPKKEITQGQILKILREKGIYVPERGKVIHQEDTYFDDKTGTLEKTGGSFRIRRKGDKTQVTYKIPVESDTEYKQRREYEIVVSKEYENNLDMEMAIKLLKAQYPELSFPENMGEILTVINDRNKLDLICSDGTILEMAFDSLKGKDGNGQIYYIRPEIEFETISGNPENLTEVYESILEKFPGKTEKNTLSKYARTKKEIQEKQLTIEEITTCAMFSQILNSTQFDKLKNKGQILHIYDKPTLTNFDNFKDFNYLADRISKIKSGEYRKPIPQDIAEKEDIAELLKDGNYEIKSSIDLEDMFCLLLSDMSYDIADKVLADFLDKNYFQEDKAKTNRLSHSQQVMLATGLICKSSQVDANLNERLIAMVSALSHDIGHVPYSHIMEQELQEKIGLFSHDNNGAEVIEEIYESNFETIIENIKKQYPNYDEIDKQEVEQELEKVKSIIQRAIREHSRTNSEQRGEGIIVQGPREADKIQYVVSDIRDLQQYFKDKGMEPAGFFSEEFIEAAVEKICEKKPYDYEQVREKLEKLFVEPIRSEKYGRTAVNVINTVEHRIYDNKEYYDVDQDVWKFIELTIGKTKDIRKEKGIDNVRPIIKRFSGYVATKKLVEEYLPQNNGKRNDARRDGLHDITNMGEIDALIYANDDILGLSKEQVARLKQGDYSQLSIEQTQAIREKTYKLLEKVFVQTGHETEEELQELAEEVKNYDTNELIETYLNAPVVTKIDEQRLGEFKVEDVQLKIIPSKNVTVTAILRTIGAETYDFETCSFEDSYYHNNLPNKTLSVRRVRGKDKQYIRVKEKIVKKVSELIRKTYEIEGEGGDSLDILVEKINKKYPGLNIALEENIPYRNVSAYRMQWTFDGKKGKKVKVREDFGQKSDRKKGRSRPVHQIEIQADPEDIKDIKNKLIKDFGRGIFTQDTKEGGESAPQHSENSSGEER